MGRPILLVTKKSYYEVWALERRDPGFLALLRDDDELSAWLRQDFEENGEAIAAAEDYLSSRSLGWERATGDLAVVDGLYSLVVSVGGDGTLLSASHAARTTPVVGVNSRPGRSVGYFCAADRKDFPAVLDGILSGQRTPRELMRIDLFLNGECVAPPVLNDVLFCAANPAATSAYRIRLDDTEEVHRSSGVWIATPAGSTAGILAAGGRKMNVADTRMQFLVREPYRAGGMVYALERGVFPGGLALTSLMPEGRLYVDGSRIEFPVRFGDRVEPRVSATPLRIYLG